MFLWQADEPFHAERYALSLAGFIWNASTGRKPAVRLALVPRIVGIWLTDLHKGSNAGGPWGLIIDGVSILLLFISLMGLILWLSLKKRLLVGLVAAFAGMAAFAAVYFAFVP